MSGWIQAGIAAVSLMFLLLTWTLGKLVGNIRHATKNDDRIGVLEDRVINLVTEQQRMQSSMIDQMKYDRDATDKRLRFLEEYFMKLAMEGRK